MIPRKFFETADDLHEFLTTQREWMYDRITESIEEAFRNGEISAHIFDATIEETESVITMRSEAEEWEASLTLALAWYQDKELYEKCIRVRDLMNSIRDFMNS